MTEHTCKNCFYFDVCNGSEPCEYIELLCEVVSRDEEDKQDEELINERFKEFDEEWDELMKYINEELD